MASKIAPILKWHIPEISKFRNSPSDFLWIVPIHKKNDRTIASNYRPISLTSTLCKILEHIISTSIHKHLGNHNILTDRQHGFRSRRSCETSLLTTIHDLTNTLEKNHQSDLLLLDFSKAFDTVPHNRLLHKLDHYGFRASTHLWIKHFLTNRTQEVLVEGCKPGQVSSGVPQGTVLGPLLFLLYINDMPTHISPGTSLKLFADNAMLYRKINKHTDQDNLQHELDRLIDWAQSWQMTFNPSKCEIMHITRSESPIDNPYTIHNETLRAVPVATHLGIDISNNFSWNPHINKIVNKANSKPLQKRANGIPLITIEYHSVKFSTIEPFNDISAGLSGTLNGNLKYHSIPLNCTKNPKYHSKTIQIPFKYPWP